MRLARIMLARLFMAIARALVAAAETIAG